jgi:hypothetical protein
MKHDYTKPAIPPVGVPMDHPDYLRRRQKVDQVMHDMAAQAAKLERARLWAEAQPINMAWRTYEDMIAAIRAAAEAAHKAADGYIKGSVSEDWRRADAIYQRILFSDEARRITAQKERDDAAEARRAAAEAYREEYDLQRKENAEWNKLRATLGSFAAFVLSKRQRVPHADSSAAYYLRSLKWHIQTGRLSNIVTWKELYAFSRREDSLDGDAVLARKLWLEYKKQLNGAEPMPCTYVHEMNVKLGPKYRIEPADPLD